MSQSELEQSFLAIKYSKLEKFLIKYIYNNLNKNNIKGKKI